MAMKLKKVLVVFKKSTLQLQALEYKEPRFLKLLDEGHASVSRVKGAHEQHVTTLQTVETELRRRSINYEALHRADLRELEPDYDLIITVGGDGTFLDASHKLRQTPILGVNSAPGTSFGHFSLAKNDNFGEIIDRILTDDLKLSQILRLELAVNGKRLPELVLNEVLVAHSNPAGTGRYIIRIGCKEEDQRSSGIWIGTPAGSTGSIKSAGGEIMDITASEYQYVVREPWESPGQNYMFLKGKLTRTQTMLFFSKMRTGALYIDGQHIEYPFPLGEELTVEASSCDLLAFVNPRVNRIFLNGVKETCP
jgi:NAD+ kinase